MYADTQNQNGTAILGGSVGTTDVSGWIVRQMFTASYTNGVTARPKIPTAAASLSEPGPPYFRTRIPEMNVISRSSAMVSFASHCHHTPQDLRAQSGPVTRPISPNSTAISPAASAI